MCWYIHYLHTKHHCFRLGWHARIKYINSFVILLTIKIFLYLLLNIVIIISSFIPIIPKSMCIVWTFLTSIITILRKMNSPFANISFSFLILTLSSFIAFSSTIIVIFYSLFVIAFIIIVSLTLSTTSSTMKFSWGFTSLIPFYFSCSPLDEKHT